MIFTGEIEVGAPREVVFDRLKDARFFASCVEGVRDLNEVDATHYTAVMETKVAYIRFKFDVSVEVTKMEAPGVIEAKVEGVPSGVVGRLTGTAKANLDDRGASTGIAYAIEVALAGKLGALGQPVLKSKAREMERSFTENLRKAFGEKGEAA
ncbi:CoxG family protein [Xanthobacter pseudotagetidis]|uniref:CoxG family protein n=1 Tax=Xanthobacter pseudotagetidis TaxID=3119911 RepID=UPI003727C726